MTASEASPEVRDPNRLPDRAAMGLPDRFVARLPADLFARQAGLLQAGLRPGGPEELAQICEDVAEPFERRYVAGSLLALLGDPRVRAHDPQMVDVPTADVDLGLPEACVDAVVERWARTGVIADWIRKECPRYRVHVDAFRIMRYPVTNSDYREFLADTGLDELPTSWRFGCYPQHRANHPVWTVSPRQAEVYAAWLSGRTERRFRLPTEAEWEYTACGGLDQEYPWGGKFLLDHANTVEHGPLDTTPVGIYPAGRTRFGAYDMAGNVEEFVSSDYAPYPGGRPVVDDLWLADKSYRVARGGSFTRFGDLARCRRRHGWFRREIYAIGFRLAEDVA